MPGLVVRTPLRSCRASSRLPERHNVIAFCDGKAVLRSAFLGSQLGKKTLRGRPLLHSIASAASLRTLRRKAVVEANLFARVSRLIRSFFTSLVSSAEDPEKILDQAVIDMQNDLVKMRQAAAQVMASQKQIERKYDQAQQTANEWYKRAQLALQKGEEDLAREALKRKKAFQEQGDSLRAQVEQQRAATDQLMSNTRLLENKLAEARSRKDTLKARAASAKTSRQINEMLGTLSTGRTALEAFEKMEEKVLAMEAEGEAAAKLLPAGDRLESAFMKLEGDSVDDELLKLKSELGVGRRPVGELPAGRPIRDAIDFELEDLKRKTRK